jgi:hypothetical protein
VCAQGKGTGKACPYPCPEYVDPFEDDEWYVDDRKVKDDHSETLQEAEGK